MKNNKKKNNVSGLILEVKKILKKHFKEKIGIGSVDYLSDPDSRNMLMRIKLIHSSQKLPKSIIVKQSLSSEANMDDMSAFIRFARDWSSLEFLNYTPQKFHNIPKFYGGNKKYRSIFIEDLGEKHISLVDLLTFSDKDKAITALTHFMKTLGSFHAASFGRLQEYYGILSKISPRIENWKNGLSFTFDELLEKLETINKILNLTIKPELVNEIREIIRAMFFSSPFTVLTHGDICPDNVFYNEDTSKLHFIDFEWAFTGDALLDGTYLRMNMPTCWCSKAIPYEIIESLETVYREELKKTILTAREDKTYYASYTYACAFWALHMLPLLKDIWQKEEVCPSGVIPKNSFWNSSENFVRPKFISALSTFINVATKNDMLPYLREVSRQILEIVKDHWPDVKPLELYPAFK